LYEKIEAHALQSGLTGLSTYASHTARPFFEAMGWDVIRANIVEKDSVRLQNWFMIKSLTA
jgi:putative acetyltransferase